MAEFTPKRKTQEGFWLWLWKIIGGLVIVLVLGLHFVINHLVAPGGLLSYSDVVKYYKIPIIPIIEGIFLVVVLSHCLIGVRSIILDLNPSQKLLKWIDWFMIVLGTACSAYGIWLLIVVAGIPIP